MGEERAGARGAAARAALASGDWVGALRIVDEPDPSGGLDEAERTEIRAQAAYGAGRFEDAVTAWERLSELHARAGDRAEAGRAAAMVAMYLMMDTGLMAPVRGWLRRAERHVDGLADCPAHAVIAMVRAYERFMCGDMGGAESAAADAIDRGTRLAFTPAVAVGRVASARVRILAGEVDEGLALLDEVAALLMAGELDPLTTGMVYCELICAAQGMALHDRAADWTDLMERWRHGEAFGGINGRCRVHRAEILRVSGPCDAAEEEALAALEELRPWMRREFGWPLVELGTIRLRKGDLDGAEEALLAAHQHGWSPNPALALLRLEQGRVDAARDLIGQAIAHPLDIPSKERPPFGDLRLAPLLDAQTEIAAAAGDAETARASAASLRSIADRYSSRPLAAAATLAESRAALTEGDLVAAADAAAAAVAMWADVGAPYETAVARVVLGETQRRSGHMESARLEWEAAQSAFEAFGAHGWAGKVAQLIEGAVPVSGQGSPQTAIFRRDGDARTVCFGGLTVVVRDLKGLRHVERLLARAGHEIHVLEMVMAEEGVGTAERVPEPGVDFVTGGVGAGLPLLDDEARAAYRRRLAEVDDDIEEARRNNDGGRLELAERDREYLLAELRRAVGLGGVAREVAGTAERARTSVTRSIRYALARLAEHHPALAAHLDQRVQTGTYCSYAADPLVDIIWEL